MHCLPTGQVKLALLLEPFILSSCPYSVVLLVPHFPSTCVCSGLGDACGQLIRFVDKFELAHGGLKSRGLLIVHNELIEVGRGRKGIDQ